jgi:hypothetical protein
MVDWLHKTIGGMPMPLKRDSAARLDNVDLFVLRFWMLDSNKRVPCGVTELALKDLATMDGEPWTTAMQISVVSGGAAVPHRQ